jgi:hypothetical protein
VNRALPAKISPQGFHQVVRGQVLKVVRKPAALATRPVQTFTAAG